MQTLSNKVLIEKLKSMNQRDNDQAISYLYASLYDKVLRFICYNKGNEEEVKDVFQDALLAFYKLVKRDKVTEDTKVEAYIFSICRNLWFKKLKKNKREHSFPVEELEIPIEDLLTQELFSIDKASLLSNVIKEIGKGCEKILLAYYYERQSMEEIAKSMNLSNTQVAKNKKYKCLKKLKAYIMNSDYYKNNLN